MIEAGSGLRPTVELVGIAASRLFGRSLPSGVDWVRVSVGIPSVRVVQGRPKRGGFLFGLTKGEELVGLEIVADRMWAMKALHTGHKALFPPSMIFEDASGFVRWREPLSKSGGLLKLSFDREDARAERLRTLRAWSAKRRGGWEVRRIVECAGGRHALLFTPRGPVSNHHSVAELVFLESLGEGCGRVLREWRAGTFGITAEIFRRRTLERVQGREEPESADSRFARVIAGIVEEELKVAGFPYAAAEPLENGIRCSGVPQWAERLYPLRGPGSWYQEVWKRGLRASPGKFPLEADGRYVTWIFVSGRRERRPLRECGKRRRLGARRRGRRPAGA